MNILISALSPIFTLILIGYIFKRIKFLSLEFWVSLDKLTYYAFFPALLVYKLSTADFSDMSKAIQMVWVVAMILVILSIFLITFQRFKRFNPPTFTSIYQGALRYNTYVYLALIDILYGDEGMVLAAFLITFIIPFINILCVSIFAIYIRDDKFSLKRLINSVIKNPLIIACLVGGFLNFSGIGLPFKDIVKLFYTPAIPLVLLSIGVGLEFRSLTSLRLDFWISSIIKLIFFPLLGFIFINFFDFMPLMKNVIILFCAMPTAVSSYSLARELKGDVKLMSSIITGQTILSFFTLSFILI